MPDVNNVVAVEGRGAFATNDYAVTALADDGSFALSYLPSKRTLTIDLTKLSGERLVASWFNPRTGENTRIGEFTDKKRHAFEPPADGDWVLVLDDAAIVRHGGRIRASIDGRILLAIDDNSCITTGTILNYGHIAIRCMIHSALAFRHLRVYTEQLPFTEVKTK